MKALYAYLTDEQYRMLHDLQLEVKQRQGQGVSISKLVRYAVNLLREEQIEDIIHYIRYTGRNE